MRNQIVELPRMRSTRMSSTASRAAACGYLAFQRSRPSIAACSLGEWAIISSGILLARFPGTAFFADFWAVGPSVDAAVSAGFRAAGLRALEGATRGPSPSALAKCGGHGASPRPAASSRAASSKRASSEPAA